MIKNELTYLALGDSYTIGEAVEPFDRWSHILVKRLKEDDIDIAYPKIIAKTGWTTDELDNAIQKENINESYDLVTLLIGVNNQYRQYPINTYEVEFEDLLKQSIHFSRLGSQRVVVVGIPDYGFTPFSKEKEFNAVKIAQEIQEYNTIAKNICTKYQVAFIDIFDISQKAMDKVNFLADDGLHFSGEMYAMWVNEILSKVKKILQNSSK